MAPSSSTSSSEGTRRRLWPWAAILAVAGCALVTCACWLSVRSTVDSKRPLLLYVGDSFTGNYRLAPGDRLEDRTPVVLPRWQVRNFAWPGARTLDMLLQVHKAQTLLGRVDRVVLPLFVTKFAVAPPYIRLDKRGDNLKWLRADSSSLAVTVTLDDEHEKKLLVHKLGLLVGFYDLLEQLYVERVQWPAERDAIAGDPAERRARIDAKNAGRARSWNDRNVDADAIATSPAARDLDLLAKYLEGQGIPLLVVWLPVGNMDIVRARFSETARDNLATVRQAALEWTRSRGIDHVDLVDALPGRYYDDFTHLDEVAGIEVVVDAVSAWVRGSGQAGPGEVQSSLGSHQTAELLHGRGSGQKTH